MSPFCSATTLPMIGCNTFNEVFVEFVALKNLNGHYILNVFLPVLLFESAFDMDSHLFLNAIFEILLLAIDDDPEKWFHLNLDSLQSGLSRRVLVDIMPDL